MTSAAPRVRAVVAGIERYAAGKAWNLDGPASDLCRYVSWLRERKVPGDAITLLASPLPDNEDAVAALGLPVRPAEQAVVYDVLTRELPGDPADLLIFVWGGHGIVDGDGNRRLFYADATTSDKRNLDFNAVLRALMTPSYPHPHRQLFVVDACQNLTSELRYASRLPHQTLPQMPGLAPDRAQHVLFAASPGEVALNDSRRRTGLFSDELLRALAEPAAAWPPDAGRLADHLEARFEQLRLDGATGQHPPYLWQRTPTREGVVFRRQGTRAEHLPLPALSKIVDAMLEVDELAGVANLQKVINLLTADIRGAVPYAGVPRTDLIQLLRTCGGYVHGRDALVIVLELGMANRADLGRVLAVLDEFWPA